MVCEVLEKSGLVFQDDVLSLVHHRLQRGEKIARHHHPEANVFFTVVAGSMDMVVDGTKAYHLTPGQVLHFDGTQSIEGEALSDSEVFVYLIKKQRT